MTKYKTAQLLLSSCHYKPPQEVNLIWGATINPTQLKDVLHHKYQSATIIMVTSKRGEHSTIHGEWLPDAELFSIQNCLQKRQRFIMVLAVTN